MQRQPNPIFNIPQHRVNIKAVFRCCKTFSEKYIFSGNANFRKRKIFPCVWLHFKKFSEKYFLVFGKEEGKHKSRKTQATTQKKIINDDKSSSTTAISDRDRDLAFFARSRSSARSHEALIAISDLPLLPTYEISRSRIFLSRLHTRSRDLGSSSLAIDRDLDLARSREGEIAISRWRDRVRRFFSCARVRSLSLSHCPEML